MADGCPARGVLWTCKKLPSPFVLAMLAMLGTAVDPYELDMAVIASLLSGRHSP